MLFSEPKIPQLKYIPGDGLEYNKVSVLFSEPKIPQYEQFLVRTPALVGFSALQRAENSSMNSKTKTSSSSGSVSVLFSEPKIPQSVLRIVLPKLNRFQCSSASRKFLNIAMRRLNVLRAAFVSVLFSEPKIPQFVEETLQTLLFGEFQCSSASRKFLNRAWV